MALKRTSLLAVKFDNSEEPENYDPGNNNAVEPEDNKPELDDDIVNLLGELNDEEEKFGGPMHKDLAKRWEHTLKNGLTTENRKNIIQKYPTAENCRLLAAPKLNLELHSGIGESGIKRDNRLMVVHRYKQELVYPQWDLYSLNYWEKKKKRPKIWSL